MSDFPSGMNFPFQISDAGGVRKVEGVDKVKSNLHALVKTTIKERVIRKDVGTIGYQKTFRLNQDASEAIVLGLIREAIIKNEPRAIGLRLSMESAEDEVGQKTFVVINFIYKNTGDPGGVSVQVK